MKSIYGKLILGFLVSILCSFSIAGYFSLRKNSDEIGRITIEELEKSTDCIADFIQLLDADDLTHILNNYAESTEMSFFIKKADEQPRYFGTSQIGSKQFLTMKQQNIL